jgi:hypothetical protein
MVIALETWQCGLASNELTVTGSVVGYGRSIGRGASSSRCGVFREYHAGATPRTGSLITEELVQHLVFVEGNTVSFKSTGLHGGHDETAGVYSLRSVFPNSKWVRL